MTLETFVRLKPAIRCAKVLNLDNHGEPLMNANLEEMIKAAKATNPKIRVQFTTNLQLTDKKRLDGLLKCEINELQVSINGTTKKTYEEIEVNAKFERLLQNLELIHKYRKNNRKNPHRLAACFVSNKLNLEELPRLPELCSEYGIDMIRVNSLQSFHEENAALALYNTDEDIARTRSVYGKTKENADRLGIATSIVRTYPYRFKCSYPVYSVSITYAGDVSSCWMLDLEDDYYCYFRGEKRRIPRITFGNVNQTEFWKIWDSEEYREYRRNFMQGRIPTYCQECPVGHGLICG